MFMQTDGWESAWSVFEAVQPLFALELPWQAKKSDCTDKVGASEATAVQNFVKCFCAGMEHAPSLLPDYDLTDNESETLSETLAGLLDFLESVVRDEISESEVPSAAQERTDLDRTDSVAESGSISSVSLQRAMLSWLSTVWPSVDVCDDTIPQASGTKTIAVLPVSELSREEKLSFPKLEALGKRVEICLSSGKNPLNSCRDLLIFEHSLDHLADGRYKVLSLNSCMQSLNKRQRSPRSSPKSKATIAVTQWDNREPWNTSTRLFGILKKRLRSCASHFAMLRLNGFEIEDLEHPATFRMYLSSCTASAWKESSCTSVPNLYEGKGDFITDMCGALRSDRTDRSAPQFLRLRFDTTHLWDATAMDRAQAHIKAHPTVSLRSLLDSGLLQPLGNSGAFKQGDKAVLALSLARCLLHLFKGPWIQQTWDSGTIHFLKKDGEAVVVDIHSPYIKCSLSKATSDPDLHSCRFMMVSFARLLLEIEIGKPIVSDDFDTAGVMDALEDLLYEVLEGQREQFARGDYNDAIEGCLGFDFALSAELEVSKDAELPHLIPKVLYQSVVVHLEKNMGLVPDPKRALAPRNLPLDQRVTMLAQSMTDSCNFDHRLAANSTSTHDRNARVSSPSSDRPEGDSSISELPINVLMDDSEEVTAHGDTKKAIIARTFLSSLASFNSRYIPRRYPRGPPKTKVCIIDTGLDLSDPVIRGFKRRIVDGYSWVDDYPKLYHDTCGHGTHIARLVLTTSVHAEIIIAKVSNDKNFHQENIQHIPGAIRWAIESGADIISLSLGFRDVVPEIQDALHEAISPDDDDLQPRIIFAAAGNWGLNYPRAFPSNERGIFCVLASDGNGYSENINPTDEGENSFRTLGVAIESAWQGKSTLLSGTSFATPIAVGMATNVLDFARLNMKLGKSRWRKLRSYQGMRAVLRLMTTGGNSNLYLCPWQLEVRGLKTTEQIAKAFKEAIDLG